MPGSGLTVKVYGKKTLGWDAPLFTGTVDRSWEDFGSVMCRIVSPVGEAKVFCLDNYCIFEANPKPAQTRRNMKDVEPAGSIYQLSTEFVDMLKKKAPPQSFYTVTFRIDQRDADRITVSGRRPGQPTPNELIKLAIMEHYKGLSCYDGEWPSRLDSIFCFYLDGDFYDKYARFTVDSISISGYDARTGEFYEIPVPSLEQLGIKDLDAAYKYYFRRVGE